MFSEVNQKLQKPGECLPSIHKALGSIPSMEGRKNGKKERRERGRKGGKEMGGKETNHHNKISSQSSYKDYNLKDKI
jgi:hypothetical protein